MDRLDIAIIRELIQARSVLPARPGVGPSNREISRRLKLPPGTVRYRINRMYRTGALKGSDVFPNPNLVGVKFGVYVVDVSPGLRKAEAVRELERVDGAVIIHDFLGSLAWVGFLYEDDRSYSRRLEEFSKIAGAEGVFSPILYPPCGVSLTRREAGLVLRLSRGKFESYGGLARELGVSVRTLERMLSKLVREGALFSLPRVDYRKMTGCVTADILLSFRSLEDARGSQEKILSLVGEYVIFAALWDVVGVCSMILPSVATLNELAEKVREVEGVVAARAEVVKSHFDQLGAVVGRQVEKWMSEKGLGAPVPLVRPS